MLTTENVLSLRLSTDRKTTPSANGAGTQANIANAFGLLSGAAYSCPGQTATCERVCYAGRLEGIFKGFRAVMASNYDAIVNASYKDMVLSLNALIDEFRAKAEKRNCEKVFRIHHDGDFLNRTYASAWAAVIRINPDVQFWAYTRSFTAQSNVVDILADIPNLALYLSVDADNIAFAKIILAEYPNVKAATLTETFDEGTEMMLTIRERPGAACPEVKGAIPLIDKEGGACAAKCKLCVFSKADIRFASKGK